MVLATEALSTDLTRKGSLVGVSAFMDHQVVGLREVAVARSADELLTTSAIHACSVFNWTTLQQEQ